MIKFLRKIWQLNRPYKGRFVLGVLFGMLNGVAQPVEWLRDGHFCFQCFVCVQFPARVGKTGSGVCLRVAAGMGAGHLRFTSKTGVATQAAGSMGWRIAVVSLIPLVVLLRGVVAYLSAYLMSWVAIRTCSPICAPGFLSICSIFP